MPTPPRRARFQIHLSTAIVLMFVAGALIYLLLPIAKVWWRYDVIANEENAPGIGEAPRGFTSAGFFFLLMLASLIINGVYRFCEWLIRRHAARKGD